MKRALLAAMIAATPAAAETLKAVPGRLDPAKAYILVEYKLQPNPMANFPGSRKTIPLVAGLSFARYDPVLTDVRGLGRAKANPVPAGQQPTEPFRNREVVKAEGARLFLIAVEPDTWVVEGWANTSFSLGSYAFRLEPGTVTDLGVVTAASDWAEGDHPPTMGGVIGAAFLGPFAKRPAIAPTRASFRPRGEGDIPVPTGLSRDRVVPVAFTPGVKFGNYLGGLVNRIEGVNETARAAAAQPGAGEAR